MQLLAYLLIPVVVGIVFAGIQKEVFKSEKNMDERKFVVRQSTIAMWVGAIDVLFFGVCIVLMSILPNDTAEWWVYLGFFLFILVGAFLSLYCMFWEVRVDGDEIRFTSFLKRTKTFTFNDIKKVKLKESPQYQQIILYSATKKLLSMESNCKGYNVFVARLTQEKANNW